MKMLLRGGVPDGGPNGDSRLPVLLREGLRVARGAFFHRLLFFYELEVTHLKPNSIAQIVIFIHLCEPFLGIAPHFNLWRALYHLRGYPSAARRDMVGGAVFSLRQGRTYPALELRDSNKG